MANFECRVVRVDDVVEHPDADRLTIVKIGGFNCISNKLEDGSWRYKKGDLVVYIPEGAVLPEYLLRRLDMWDDEKGRGILTGSEGNRCKAIKLRGIVSQGILYGAVKGKHTDDYWIFGHELEDKEYFTYDEIPVVEGQDVAEFLGITKYEPVIPTHMNGQVMNVHGYTLNFDVENIQKYPDVFEHIEDNVSVTEKLHGTFCGLALVPGLYHPEAVTDPNYDGISMFAFSKGLGAQGLAFKNVPENAHNIYHKTLLAHREDLISLYQYRPRGTPIYVLGEVYGKGIQDLHYGTNAPEFRVFDIYVGFPGAGVWVSPYILEESLKGTYFRTVPQLYQGGFDWKEIEKLRDAPSSLGGLREGVVIRTANYGPKSYDERIGRKILKAINPAYLLRKGKDVTEYA